MTYSIDLVVRKARRQWPHLADDIEQEIRLAHWLALQKPVPEGKRFNPAFAKVKGKHAAIDFARKFIGTVRTPEGRGYRPAPAQYDTIEGIDEC